jgi:enoyl-CoA hydratase/carnithine racemase
VDPEDSKAWQRSTAPRHFDLATPLVCAVNGHARAGGFDLMLAAELRFAVPEATFALEEVALGLYPTGNATVLLPRQIAWVHAQELLLTARPIDAARRGDRPGEPNHLARRVLPATFALADAIA